jgi:hypothetical protein
VSKGASVIVSCYASRVERISLPLHLVVLVALIVNLWFGGDMVEAWAGYVARAFFEILLILGYVVLVIGMRVPLRWWRRDKP